jgi:hypothetical protein
MFDLIKFEYRLPIPDKYQTNLSSIDWEKQEFATYSFQAPSLKNYSISVDGHIYLEKEEGGIEKIDYTGELKAETVVYSEENDFLVEVKILYFKGDLKEVKFFNCGTLNNEARKKTQADVGDLLQKELKRSTKWWYKIFNLYCFLVREFFLYIRYVLGLLFKMTWFFQRILTNF